MRFPRKIKKALKFVFLYPRVCHSSLKLLQYGAVGIVGRNTKWKLRAAKIKRNRDLGQSMSDMAVRFRKIYSRPIKQQYADFNSDIFEWEVII